MCVKSSIAHADPPVSHRSSTLSKTSSALFGLQFPDYSFPLSASFRAVGPSSDALHSSARLARSVSVLHRTYSHMATFYSMYLVDFICCIYLLFWFHIIKKSS